MSEPISLADYTDREILDMAAKHLTDEAAELKASHTLSGGVIWGSHEMDIAGKREHDLALALSARLAKIAKRYRI